MDLVTGALLFAAGILAKPMAELLNYAVTEIPKRRKSADDLRRAREDEAAKQCRVHLDRLRKDIPLLASQLRTTGPFPRDLNDQVEDNLRDLEGNFELFETATAARLRELLGLLRSADSIFDPSQTYAHYGQLQVGVDNLAAEVRAVLSSRLRREPLPKRSGMVAEYSIAQDDMRELHDDFPMPPDEQFARARSAWRLRHGVSDKI